MKCSAKYLLIFWPFALTVLSFHY